MKSNTVNIALISLWIIIWIGVMFLYQNFILQKHSQGVLGHSDHTHIWGKETSLLVTYEQVAFYLKNILDQKYENLSEPEVVIEILSEIESKGKFSEVFPLLDNKKRLPINDFSKYPEYNPILTDYFQWIYQYIWQQDYDAASIVQTCDNHLTQNFDKIFVNQDKSIFTPKNILSSPFIMQKDWQVDEEIFSFLIDLVYFYPSQPDAQKMLLFADNLSCDGSNIYMTQTCASTRLYLLENLVPWKLLEDDNSSPNKKYINYLNKSVSKEDFIQRLCTDEV